MIILDTGDKSLEILLGGAVTTNQLPWTTSYITIGDDESVTPGNSYGLTNGGTAVTIVGSPDPTNDIQLKALTVINKDTVPATVTIRENDASIPTLTSLITVILQVDDNLLYIDTIGFFVLDANGNIRSVDKALADAVTAVITANSTFNYPGGNEGNLNGATPVIAIPVPPDANTLRKIEKISVYNADTVAHDFTLTKKKGINSYILEKKLALAAGSTYLFLPVPITLDATDESVTLVDNAGATTTEPTFDAEYVDVI